MMSLYTRDMKKGIEERLEKNKQRRLDLIRNEKIYETSMQELTCRVSYVIKQMKKNVTKELEELDQIIADDEACLTNMNSTMRRYVWMPNDLGTLKDVQLTVKAQENIFNHVMNSCNEQLETLQIRVFTRHDQPASVPRVLSADHNVTKVQGVLKQKDLKRSKYINISPKKRVRHKPILHDRIAVTFDGDKMQPMIVSFLVVKLHGTKMIVMSDMPNCCIKCYFIKRAVEHSEMGQDFNTRTPDQDLKHLPSDRSTLVLNGPPGGMAQTCSDVMVVVITEKKLITFFGLVPHLEVDRHIQTQKQYGGIAFFNDVFVVSAPSWSQPSVDILDLRGHILKSISPGPSEEPYFDVPWFVTATGEGHILVSDTYDNYKKVTCLSQDGDLVCSFKPDYTESNPRDTAVDDRGDVYICDSGRNKVMIFSSTGQYEGCLLSAEDGLDEPWLITFDEDCHLYVKEAGKDIKVFR